MKTLIGIISIIFLLSSGGAQAQTASLSLDAPKVDPASSQAIRREKKYSAQAKILGTGSHYTTEKGLAIGYYLSPDQELNLEYSVGDDEWSNSYDGSRLDAQSFAFSYREFLGNSFYAKLGIEYTKYGYSHNYGYENIGYSFNADRFAGKFAVGNQWQWSNFTFGIDWISVAVPITTSFSNEKTTSGWESARQSAKDSISNTTYVSGLNVYVGATF